MPIYEYVCRNCEETFALLRWNRGDDDVSCPRCGSQNIKKLVSHFSCTFPAESGTPSGDAGGFTGGG